MPVPVTREGNPESKGMKRAGNLYEQICSMDNLILADAKARKGKAKQYGIQLFDRDGNLAQLQHALQTKTYTTPAYTTFRIYEPKERIIYRLPYPDRVVHHAVMNLLEPMFTAMFTADTYSCIKGRGIHGASKALKRALKDVAGTQYCLKLDIKKFYPSIDHDILKTQLRRKLKDNDLLHLLDNIIDSADGVPIGNYLSQYFANLYLTAFDRYVKGELKVTYYFRYADDIVILAPEKAILHKWLADIRNYLHTHLKLEVKSNYQVFPVAKRGIDFVGYVHYHTHIRLRKSIKQAFARMVAKRKNPASIASYNGWAKHCNSRHLVNTLLNGHTTTDNQVQRTEHTARKQPIRRQIDRNGRTDRYGDHPARLQDRAEQIYRQGQRQMPDDADRSGQSETGSIQRQHQPDGDGREDRA